MSSEVIVNIAPEPFQQQIGHKHQELVSVERSAFLGLTSTDPVIRANQLEQNIKFLQEQHQIMLAGLHSEIESLKQKNRDLQFQIVFSKEMSFCQSSSSGEDDSPRRFALGPCRVEIRKKLSKGRTRNVCVQTLIVQRKKKMSTLENEKLDLAAVGKKVGKENVSRNYSKNHEKSLDELHDKLEGATRLIRRLRRENEEQRKEIISLKTSLNKIREESRRSEGNSSYRTSYRNGQPQRSRFPPLHSHQHRKNRAVLQVGQNSDRGGALLTNEAEVVGRTPPSLPYLRDRNAASTSTGYNCRTIIEATGGLPEETNKHRSLTQSDNLTSLIHLQLLMEILQKSHPKEMSHVKIIKI